MFIISNYSSLNCVLNDNSGNFIRNLADCSISPNTTFPGTTYYITYSYNPSNYQANLIDSIKIVTTNATVITLALKDNSNGTFNYLDTTKA